MALPTLTTALPIASLAMLSFCGWGPGGNGGPRVEPEEPRWETGWFTETDVDWNTDINDPDTEPDTEADTEPDTDTPSSSLPTRYALGASHVAASEGNTCIIASGALTCWGDDRFGVVTDTPAGTATDVDLGWDFACAVIDGGVSCWGDDTFGQVSQAPVGTYTQVSAGTYHACAVSDAGAVVCWGSTTLGKTAVPDGIIASAVSAGDQHTCAVTAEADVTCWGDAPSLPPAETSVLQTWAGAGVTCVELNDALTSQVSCHGTPAGEFPATAFDAPHSGGICYQNDTAITCTTPTALLDDATDVLAIARGGGHVCALDSAGDVLVWGHSEHGAHLLSD